jgi:hypothetical protein
VQCRADVPVSASLLGSEPGPTALKQPACKHSGKVPSGSQAGGGDSVSMQPRKAPEQYMYGCRHTKAQAYRKHRHREARARRHKPRTHKGPRVWQMHIEGHNRVHAVHKARAPAISADTMQQS